MRILVTFYNSTILSCVAILAAVCSVSFSQASYENSTAVGLKEKKQTIMLVNNFSYSLTSDAVDNNDQKVFYQGVRYNGTLFFLDQYYATFGAGANYRTVDDELQEYDNGAFQLSDLSIGLGTNGFTLLTSKTDSLSLFTNLNSQFPLSERSRNEGYKAVPTLSLDLAYQSGPWGFVLSAQQSYVFNSYETNLAGNPNLEWSTAGGITARYNWNRFRFQYSYRLGVRHFLDGSNIGSSGNNFSIIAMLTKSIWAGAFTNNVNYIDEQFVDLWFYDPYVRTYNLRMGVTF